ncbi:hypothetical protein ASG81_12895 [Paenibacillus sp. Soil522]|nr:hypothetical protein ASG81_12895 [Paenibacillus sp. Soil522]
MKTWLVTCCLVLALVVSGCGNKGEGTPVSAEETEAPIDVLTASLIEGKEKITSKTEVAKRVVQGLISKDASLIESVVANDIDALDPQHYINTFSQLFENRDLKDFTFTEKMDGGQVLIQVISADGQINFIFGVSKIDDWYFFNGGVPTVK